jgi:hypothetical protein
MLQEAQAAVQTNQAIARVQPKSRSRLRSNPVSVAGNNKVPVLIRPATIMPANKVRVVFSYDQQVTSQVIEIDLNTLNNSTEPADSAMAQAAEKAISTETSPDSPIQAELSGQAAAQATPLPAQKQTESNQTSMETEASTLPQSSDDASNTEESPSPTELLPTTGAEKDLSNLVIVAMSLLLVLGLGIGGWKAVATRR